MVSGIAVFQYYLWPRTWFYFLEVPEGHSSPRPVLFFLRPRLANSGKVNHIPTSIACQSQRMVAWIREVHPVPDSGVNKSGPGPMWAQPWHQPPGASSGPSGAHRAHPGDPGSTFSQAYRKKPR